MTFRQTFFSGLALATAAGFSFAASAQEEASTAEEFNLTEISCWDVMTLEEGERTSALLLIYGYHAGATNAPMMSGNMIEADLAKVSEYCGENPDANAIDALN